MQLNLQKLASFKLSDGLRKVVANTGWLFADRILRMGLGLFVGVWVARYLGVEQFGLFSYATAFVSLFGTLATLGLPSLVVRTITHEPEKREQILGTTFLLQFFGGIASLLLAFSTILIFRHNDPLTVSLVAILASAGIFQAFGTIDVWFQSQVQSKYVVLAKNTAFVIVSLIKIVLINIHAPLLAFAGATLAETVIGAMGLIFIYRLQGYSLWLWCWSLPLAKTLLRESWPLMISTFAGMIYLRIDQIMLAEMVGNQAVGLYSSATRISEAWYVIATATASSVAPAIYAAKKAANENLYYWRIEKFLRVLSLISIFIALPMTFAAGKTITLLFGNEYVAAGPILAIHIWATLFVFTGMGTSLWFIAEGLTHLSLQKTVLGAVINISLNLLLIPPYAGLGAAIATLISYSIAAFFMHGLHPKTRKIFHVQLKSLNPFIHTKPCRK